MIARSVGALGTPIFTRLLTPTEYGLFPLYNTWLSVITVIVTLELTGGVIYRGLQRYSGNKEKFLSSAFGLFLCIFTLFCALYFAFSGVINKITGLGTLITSLMLAQIFANTVIAFYTARARYEYRYKSVAFLSLISSLGIPFVSVLLITVGNVRAEARIIGSCVTLSLIAIPLIIEILRSSRRLFDKDTWGFLLRFNLPLLPHYLSMALILRVGEITVGRFFGTEALGRYSVAISLGMSMTVITNGIISALSPWLLRKTAAKETEKIRDLLLILTKALCILCLVILAFAPELLGIITPPEFHSALPAVYPLELSVIPMFLSGALVSCEMYYEKSATSAIPSIICAALSTLLSLTVLPRVDYRFVSIFVLASYLLLSFLNTLTFKKLSGDTPLHVRKSAVSFALTIGYAALLFLFRDVFLSRAVLVLPLLPTGFVLGRDIWTRIRE